MLKQKGRIQRNLLNCPPKYQLFRDIVQGQTEKPILSILSISTRYNSLFGYDVICDIMCRSAALGVSAGGYLNAHKAVRKKAKQEQQTGQRDAVVGGVFTRLPTGEWLRGILDACNKKDIYDSFSDVVGIQLNLCKKLKLIPKDGMVVAVDVHKIPRYDKKPDEWLHRGESKHGTTFFETYMTVQCVTPRINIVLGIIQMSAPGAAAADFIPKITQICDNFDVPIRCMLLDREFFSVDVLCYLDSKKISYITPCKNTGRVIEVLCDFDQLKKRGLRTSNKKKMVLSNNRQKEANYNMIIKNRAKYTGQSTKKDADKLLLLLPEQRWIGFATNMPKVDVYLYKKRWGIETGYKMIESMRVKTHSSNSVSRLFCFMFSTLLYNAWVLMNAVYARNIKRFGGGRNKDENVLYFTQTAFKILIIQGMIKFGLGPGPPPG